jgi:hypothetical protein
MAGRRKLSRREALRLGAVGFAGTTLLVRSAAQVPVRAPLASTPPLPDIQHDVSAFLGPVETIAGVPFRFGPVFTKFMPANLTRVPTRRDQSVLADALHTIEDRYRFAADGVFTFVAYGVPYFQMLPSGLAAAHVPRLANQPARFALEEAVPSPTDVTVGLRGPRKQRFNVPVRIESNAMLFTIRGDRLEAVQDVEAWLAGSDRLAGRNVASPRLRGLVRFEPSRLMFAQRGMPRRVADRARLTFATRIHPDSPMWMGFADQQVSGSGPAAIVTFQGNPSARLTTARAGDYFDNGSIQHLSHVILDLEQFFLGSSLAQRTDDTDGESGNAGDSTNENDETFLERVQYMFRSTPPPSPGFADQLTNGGGPAFLPNEFKGQDDALRAAQGIGTPGGKHRIGHLSALQRSSRAPDGTAMHVRLDGPGFDRLDVPNGSVQPKLQFSIFVPTAEFFARMRSNQASLDLARAHAVAADDQGLERFLTTTRRQNFLVPPRRHRAFPLIELAGERRLV